MAVPFRRTSKTKKRMRRTHVKLSVTGLVKCPNCGALIKAHNVCPKCGYYDGKLVVAPKKKKDEAAIEAKKEAKKAKKAKAKKEAVKETKAVEKVDAIKEVDAKDVKKVKVSSPKRKLAKAKTDESKKADATKNAK